MRSDHSLIQSTATRRWVTARTGVITCSARLCNGIERNKIFCINIRNFETPRIMIFLARWLQTRRKRAAIRLASERLLCCWRWWLKRFNRRVIRDVRRRWRRRWLGVRHTSR